MFANFACPKKVEAKTMKRKAAIITILSIMFIGGILIIFIPTQSRHHLEAICRVEGNVCYAVLLNNGHDTLFISLKNDSAQIASVHNNLPDNVHYQSGAFVSNEGHVITSDAFTEDVPDSLTPQQLHSRLLALDSLMKQKIQTEKGEEKELNEYARTHTVIDDGYNDVMDYRVKVTQRVEQTDSVIRRIQQALTLPQLSAHLQANIYVSNQHMTPQSADIAAHHDGLLLLQTHTKDLPKGCHRFSVYRWGVSTLKSHIYAYNDIGSKCQLPLPTISDSNSEHFTAAEGGIWVNQSGHISGVLRHGQRITSYKVAQLMRSVHTWPMWWWHNFVSWCKNLRLPNNQPQKKSANINTNKLQCKHFILNDSLSYTGLVCQEQINNHPMRHGYGILTLPNGTQYIGYWHNDTLKSGKCLNNKGVYEGEFNDQGKFHGYGTLYAANGEVYMGEWKNGKRFGHGFSSRSQHMVRCGSWRNGRFQGERMVYTADRIYGIDLSRHQHEKGAGRRVKKYGINWNQLRIYSLGSGRRVQGRINYPVSYVYIKATEGRSLFNKYYPNDLQQARKHGIAVGSYHFFTTTSTGAQQADYFLRMAWIAPNDLPPVLDLEPTNAQIQKMGGNAALFKQVLIWLHRVENRHGKRPVLYVGQLFVNNHLKYAPAELRNYDVWIARYGEYKPYVKLLHWQLTPYGRVKGIHGEVDINVFNGTKEAFDQYRHQ